VLDELYRAKAVHLVQQKRGSIDIGSPLEDSSVVSAALIKVRSLKYQLGIKPVENSGTRSRHRTPKQEIQHIVSELDGVFDFFSKNAARKKEIEARLKVLYESRQSMGDIIRLGIAPGLYRKTIHMGYKAGYVNDISILNERLGSMKEAEHLLVTADHMKKKIVAVFYDCNRELGIIRALADAGFQELKIPEEFLSKKDPLSVIDKEAKDLEAEKKALDKKTNAQKRESSHMIIHAEKVLSEASKKSEAPLMFGETASTSIVTGWVPKKKASKLISSLESLTSKNIYVEELDIPEDENVPVKLNNPVMAKPYEFLLRLFSIPSYREIDPSIFMFFTFPLFFGFMLGDAGYGLLTLIAFLIARKMFKQGKDLINILIFSSVATIVFGLVFGEFFGFEMGEFGFVQHIVQTIHINYPILQRSAGSVTQLIIISLIIGALHINFGLALGFINVYNKHGLKQAIFEKGGWFMLELGAVAVALGLSSYIHLSPVFGFTIIAAAIILIYLGEGISGIVELPSIFVHIGSYMRLMAIGLASVALAGVINEQSASLLGKGPLWIIFAVFVFAMGHLINLMLGLIGPFLHSLRLHYVENFTKFYTGGGTEFSPFGRS